MPTNVVVTGHGFIRVSTDEVANPEPQLVQLAIVDKMIARSEHTLSYLEKHAPRTKATEQAPDGLYLNRGDMAMALVQLALLTELRRIRDRIECGGALV